MIFLQYLYYILITIEKYFRCTSKNQNNYKLCIRMLYINNALFMVLEHKKNTLLELIDFPSNVKNYSFHMYISMFKQHEKLHFVLFQDFAILFSPFFLIKSYLNSFRSRLTCILILLKIFTLLKYIGQAWHTPRKTIVQIFIFMEKL